MPHMPDRYTQTCPACLPVLLCLLYVVLLFRMLGPGRSGFAGAHVGAGEGGSGDGDASSEGAAGVIFPGNWDQMTETQRRNCIYVAGRR